MNPGELERVRHAVEAAGKEGLRVFAEAVLAEAKRNVGVGDPSEDPDPLVALADSGHIEPEGDGFVIIFDTVYATKQHEDMRLEHPRGGGPRYLERAVTTLAPAAEGIVGSKIKARTAGTVFGDV